MTRYYVLPFCLISACLPSFAQTSQPQNPASSGTDPKQSFVSPLGLGTGATAAVTQSGTSITAAVASQTTNPVVNFWQVAFSGTTNTNGQALVYSTLQSDAPGFKGKVGLGHSSMIKPWVDFTSSAGNFMAQAWCRDLVKQVNKTLPAAGQISIKSDVKCAEAVALEKAAFSANPPDDPKTKQADQQVLSELESAANSMNPSTEGKICTKLKDSADFFQFCPGQKSHKEYADQKVAYPGLDTYTVGAPSAFQWKLWGSWAPVLTSTPYYAVANGAPDFSKKLNWTQLLSTGVGDIALYYRSLAFGVEGGFGQTVQIVQQNVCKNTTSGSVTAQQCSMAMVGKPNPKNSWIASSTLQVAPLPFLNKGTGLSTGAQIQFSYTAPTSGGHSSEIAVPLYLSPSTKQVSFVVGIQPTWDWNTNPMIGNKFSISVFVGARPSITKN